MRRTSDIVFRKARVAVFVDGCFWHKCPDHFVLPATNAEYWRQKIDGNVNRDNDTDFLLAEEGWEVLRFWEHEDPKEVAEAIASAVEGHRLARS